MRYQATKIPVRCSRQTVQAWANYMITHADEVTSALRQEGVRHELWFLGQDDASLYVIGVMDVDDKAASVAISNRSTLSVDRVHRRFKKTWDRTAAQRVPADPLTVPEFPDCVLLFEAWANPSG